MDVRSQGQGGDMPQGAVGVLHGQHHPCHTRRPLPGPGPAGLRGERPPGRAPPLGGDLLGGGAAAAGAAASSRPQPGGPPAGRGPPGRGSPPRTAAEKRRRPPRRHTPRPKDPPDPGGERGFHCGKDLLLGGRGRGRPGWLSVGGSVGTSAGWTLQRGFPPGPGRGIQAFSRRKPGRKSRGGDAPRPPWVRGHSFPLARFGVAGRSGTVVGYFVTHVRALIWGAFSCGATQPRGFPFGEAVTEGDG